MQCEIVRQECSTSEPDRLPFWKRLQVQRHLASCASCATWVAKMRQIDAQIGAWPSETPAPELRARTATSLAAHDPAPVSASPALSPEGVRREFNRAMIRGDSAMKFRISFAFCAVLLTTVLLLNAFAPGRRAEAALRRVQAAMQAVRYAHITYYSNMGDPAPQWRKLYEEWYQDGKWRREGEGGTHIIANGVRYHYDPVQKKVVAKQESGKPQKMFTIHDLLGNLSAPNMQMAVTEQEAVKVNDRRVRRLIIKTSPSAEPKESDPTEYFRLAVDVDEATSLPLRIEMQNHFGDTWQGGFRRDFEYNAPLPASKFDPASLTP